MSDADVSPRTRELGDRILDAIRGHVSRSLSPLNTRLRAAEARCESADQLIADLEARLAALEAKQ